MPPPFRTVRAQHTAGCPVVGKQRPSVSYPPDEIDELMLGAINKGATADDAMRQTEAALAAKYAAAATPCPVGGDKVPQPLVQLFGMIPRPLIERVHGLFKRKG